jgi:hypothetical protein
VEIIPVTVLLRPHQRGGELTGPVYTGYVIQAGVGFSSAERLH